MRERIKQCRLSLGASALAALALSGVTSSEGQHQPPSRLAGEWIIRRSAVVCARAATCRTAMTFTVETVVGARPGRSDREFWLVSCSNGQEDAANLIWDGRTGLLESISQRVPRTAARVRLAVGREHARLIAENWLRRLPFAADGTRWRPMWGAPSSHTWQFGWHSASRYARVVIDRMSGELVTAVAYSRDRKAG